MDELVGFLGSSIILLLVLASYLGATGLLLFLLDKLLPAKS